MVNVAEGQRPVPTILGVLDLEHQLIPVVAGMNLAGVPVDREKWLAAEEECREELYAVEARIEACTPKKPQPKSGWNLDGHADPLAMLHASGLPGEVASTAEKTIAKYIPDIPLIEDLIKYRKAKRAKDTAEADRLRNKILGEAPPPPPIPYQPWNLRSPQQVKELAGLLGFDMHDGTDELELLKRKDTHEFFSLMLEARRLTKLVDTYGVNWIDKHYDPDTGRVYPSWWQWGTTTGRFACSNPNFQQLPNEGPYRSCIRAPEGRMLVSADYSQIELRIAAKIAPDSGMLEAFEAGRDIHIETAKLITSNDSPTGEQRTKAKVINFGLLFGMRAESLPDYALREYKVPLDEDEARNFYDAYFKERRGIASWHAREKKDFYSKKNKKCVDRYTLSGRRRKDIRSLNEALNHPVQGTAGDGMKYAMVLFDRRRNEVPSAQLIATVHDELLVECDEDEAKKVEEVLRGTMIEAMDKVVNAEGPKVPIDVESKVAKAWVKE